MRICIVCTLGTDEANGQARGHEPDLQSSRLAEEREESYKSHWNDDWSTWEELEQPPVKCKLISVGIVS